jgi:5'-nucleotidase
MIKILVTNDDGIASPGLRALARAMRPLGQVWVVAPDRERTAAAHALTLHKPLRVTCVEPRVFAVSGTPTDCVNLALKKLLRGTPALVVSGINRGVNLGDDVTYSGTVSAALEGTIMGIPSIAVSQEVDRTFRYDVAAVYAARVARAVLKYGLPAETLLNVNVPDRPRMKIAGVRVTALSRRRFDEPIIEKTDPHGRKYYWIAGTRISWSRKGNSDHEMLRRGFVTITPIHLDVTHHEAMEQLREWEALIEGGRKSSFARLSRLSGSSRSIRKTRATKQAR